MKLTTRLAVAAAATAFLLLSGHAQAAPPRKDRVIPPARVSALMKAAKFKVLAMYRKGANWVVRAKGASGNEVLTVLDGRNGKIIGLDVVKWAPGARRVARGSRGNTFTGDVYEFGYSVPVAALATWVVYEEASWSVTTTEWLEVTVETVTWSEVTYESSVTEVSYEEYSVEYSETYDVSLTETVSSYESYEETIEESYESTQESWEESSESSEESSSSDDDDSDGDDDDSEDDGDDGDDDDSDDDDSDDGDDEDDDSDDDSDDGDDEDDSGDDSDDDDGGYDDSDDGDDGDDDGGDEDDGGDDGGDE